MASGQPEQDNQQPEAPEVLYHYTDGAGLLGILTSRNIWATDVEFMSDAHELAFVRTELRNWLYTTANRILQDLQGGGGPEVFRARLLTLCADNLDPTSPYRVFATCFSEARDLLSQWRGYGSDVGYAIGIESPALRGLRASPDLDFRGLQRVLYDLGEAKNVLLRVADELAHVPLGHPGAHSDLSTRLITLPLGATVKDAAFSEEREWRAICIGSTTTLENQRFRQTLLGPTPYIELPLPESCIREVVVGPGAYSDVRRNGVRLLLDKAGWSEAVVSASVAPLRM